MRMSGAAHLFALLSLPGCAPEVIDLAMFGADSGASAPLDAGSPSEEGELDGGDLLDGGSDAGYDAGSTTAALDARVREDAQIDASRSGCRGPEDCGPNQMCDFIGCAADRTGRCVPSPTFCNGAADEVCGCDGLKYFNECLRRSARVAKDESCAQLDPCDRNTPCPAGPTGRTYCSHLLTRSQCSRPNQAMRACYVMPESCSFGDALGGDLFSACDAQASGGTAPGYELCYTPCQAIKLQSAFAPTRWDRCAPPPSGGGGPGFSGTQ